MILCKTFFLDNNFFSYIVNRTTWGVQIWKLPHGTPPTKTSEPQLHSMPYSRLEWTTGEEPGSPPWPEAVSEWNLGEGAQTALSRQSWAWKRLRRRAWKQHSREKLLTLEYGRSFRNEQWCWWETEINWVWESSVMVVTEIQAFPLWASARRPFCLLMRKGWESPH